MQCVTSSCPWFITSVTSCLYPEGPGKSSIHCSGFSFKYQGVKQRNLRLVELVIYQHIVSDVLVLSVVAYAVVMGAVMASGKEVMGRIPKGKVN